MTLDLEMVKTVGIFVGGLVVGMFAVYKYLKANFPVDPNSKNGLSAAISALEKRLEAVYLTIKEYKSLEETESLKRKLDLQDTFAIRNKELAGQFRELADEIMKNRNLVVGQYENLLIEMKKRGR